ncbi:MULTISPECIES: hypothetical protein [unclassified Aurantimonas]|uniref:hypothetical protein n=1 Tax=unclassified Aurantimonas TaxID=2638230 RepID=UPI002E1886AB|nr:MULTISPECIES: hypothetical protein [unclassified Aurantimonas]MEC5289437.1 hypothetical protein [Aurantimonas sp. C2-3-R2]MEC5410517.1 hypothetical protein [Aurantimonas sp. C2-4-R8]
MNYEAKVTTLPDHMHEAILRWINDGVKPGRFLRAVLENDLQGAVFHADDTNADRLRDFVRFFHNEAPSECFGSVELVRAWAEIGGLNGIRTWTPDRALEAAE